MANNERALRGQLIRLAYENPEFRQDILPLVAEGADKQAFFDDPAFDDPFVRTLPKLLGAISGKLQWVDQKTFMKEHGHDIVEHPVSGVPVKILSLKGSPGANLRRDLWQEWRAPRAQKNRSIVISTIAKHTGNSIREVERGLRKDLTKMIQGASGQISGVAQSIWSSIAGAYQTGRGKFLPSRAASQLRIASERQLRKDLIRVAYHNPEVRAEILEILED